MKKILPYLKSAVIGMVMGGIGAILGVFPMLHLRSQIFGLLIRTYSSYRAIPEILLSLINGFPLDIGAILYLPVGGLLFGLAGAAVGLLRRSSRIWLWGLMAGLLLNFLVSFHAQ